MWYKPIGSCIVQRKHTFSHPAALESILRVPNSNYGRVQIQPLFNYTIG